MLYIYTYVYVYIYNKNIYRTSLVANAEDMGSIPTWEDHTCCGAAKPLHKY